MHKQNELKKENLVSSAFISLCMCVCLFVCVLMCTGTGTKLALLVSQHLGGEREGKVKESSKSTEVHMCVSTPKHAIQLL